MTKEFVADYQIFGTLHLECKNAPAAMVKARAIVRRIQEEADSNPENVYIEADLENFFDADERYGKR